MGLQNSFDLAKKRLEGGNLDDGYTVKSGKTYTAYHTNADWKDFIKEMVRDYHSAYDEYRKGDGGEIREKRYPPKMASYGSSSRFIYKLSRDIPNFHFEKKLDICIPSRYPDREAQASLDGYLEKQCIYVEAKCREIYSESHPTFNEKYKEYYTFLAEKTSGRFGYTLKASTNKKGETTYKVYFSWENEPINHLDLKQLLCHFLGIAKKSLLAEGKQAPTLLYLVYKPSDELFKILEQESTKTANSIRACWDSEHKEAIGIDLPLLYKYAVHYLHERKEVGANLTKGEVERISDAFSFKYCTQENYLALLR